MKGKAPHFSELPGEHTCNLCQATKPITAMVIVRNRREGVYQVRPRCKDCHNQRERGHRREWKRKYLQRWRARNKELNDSYWRNPEARERARINHARRFAEKHDAILIQGRMNRRGMGITIKEAEELLKRFGRCYPTRLGLTPEGLRECERIRSAFRRSGSKRRPTNFEIRLMVYEDGLHIPPSKQPKPFKDAAKRLRRLQRARHPASLVPARTYALQ